MEKERIIEILSTRIQAYRGRDQAEARIAKLLREIGGVDGVRLCPLEECHGMGKVDYSSEWTTNGCIKKLGLVNCPHMNWHKLDGIKEKCRKLHDAQSKLQELHQSIIALQKECPHQFKSTMNLGGEREKECEICGYCE